MSDEFEDFGVPRRNEQDCEQAATALRALLGFSADEPLPPIMEVFDLARQKIPEAKNLELVVQRDDDMGDDLAHAKPESQEIFAGQSFVERALADEPDARFYSVHELVHIVFHRGTPRFFRKAAGNVVYTFLHDKRETAEWQSDRIARAMFMPPRMVIACKDALDLANRAKVPLRHAIQRIEELAPPTSRKTPPDVAIKIARMAQYGAGPASEKQKAELKKLELWNALPTVPGEGREEYRNCGGYQIRWSDFGKTTGCGWYIEHGRVVSFFATQSR